MTIVRDDAAAAARSLEGLALGALRDEWRRRYGEPPKLRSVELLSHLLAWRIQAEAVGGLAEDATAALKRKDPSLRGPALSPGTVVAREWRGVRHEVQVLQDGVAYDGHRYASLSEVARTITGVRWSGPRFFGLLKARHEPA